ncbi:helix-turn-helix domain-containing protein [Paenibacillus shenyangensis]|uniref:helix-turn-helix domain-containing protein n=1 Tax=Paenibacillus sp. A9 TaxID=1284352 RepID=UPI00037BD9D8|nr:helix-turn-helix domain-containing protein [Paenibacillus sp. A9]
MNTKFLSLLRFMMKMLYVEYHMPMYILDMNGEMIDEYPIQPFNPLYADKLQGLALLTAQIPDDYPAVKATNFLEQYLMIPLHHNNVRQGTLVAGPFFHAIVPEELVKGIIRDYHLTFRQQDNVLEFYRRVPLISKERIYNAAVMIHYMLYQVQLDIAEVIQHTLYIDIVPSDLPAVPDEPPSPYDNYEQHSQTSYHQNPEMEKVFLQYIREGRKEDLVKWELGFPTEKLGVLSKKSLLRSEKNLAICSITLATRAAMDGGVNAEIAYTLSDLHIQAIEECQTPAEVKIALQKCHTDFVDRVLEGQRKRYSEEINICRNYIFNHLYEPIHLHQLAAAAQLNADYLSQVFRSETGVSPVMYIQQARIEEAKRLIGLSAHSLAEIAAMLQFHDQSYFTKIFKKYVGITPKQYRKNPTGGERAALIAHQMA